MMEQQEEQRGFYRLYDRIAHAYDLVLGPILKHGQELAVHAMDIKPGSRILEVGMGTGLTLSLYDKDAQITGIDLSEEMLKKAEVRIRNLQMPNAKIAVMSAEDLKYKDNSFDYVYAPSVLSVVNDPQKVINEMIRVCKPSGTVCVVSHFSGSSWAEKTWDRMIDPLTQRLVGFRMTTPRDVIEKTPQAKVILKKKVFFLNFSTLYLIKKGT